MLKSLAKVSQQFLAGKNPAAVVEQSVHEAVGLAAEGKSTLEKERVETGELPGAERPHGEQAVGKQASGERGVGLIAFTYKAGQHESGLNTYVNFDDFMHVGFRPAENKIVLNTFSAGTWETERNVVGQLKSGLYELDLTSSDEIALRFGGSRLIDLSLSDRKPFPLTRVHKLSVYGDVKILTPEGEFDGDMIAPAASVQPQDAALLSILRDQPPGLIETLSGFALQSYVDLNPDLHARFADRGEALEHFLDEGIDQVRQFNGAEIFDPDFYRARYEDVEELSPAEAYAHWLSLGRHEGRSPSEMILLKRLGLSIPEIPSSFTAERYGKLLARSGWSIAIEPGMPPAELSDPGRRFRTKWDAFEHWISQIPATGALVAPLDETSASAAIYKDLADAQVLQGHSEMAVRLYWRSILLDATRAQTWQHLGDVLLRCSDYAAAHHAYSQVVALDATTYWTHRNLIQAEEGLGRVRAALDQAQSMLEQYPDRIEAQEIIDDLVRKVFEFDFKRAKSLAMDGQREDAVAAIRSTFRDAFVADDPHAGIFGARAGTLAGRTGAPRILLFGTPYLRQCTFYRIEQKLAQLRAAGFEADFVPQDEPQRFMSEVGAYDVAIFYRVPAFPDIEKAILYCRQIGVTTFYEIDDLVYDPEHFPDSIENYRGQLSIEEYANLVVDAPLFERAMTLCEYGIASTPTLQRRMESIVARKKCFVHRNAMDQRHERFVASCSHWASARRSDVVTLFYASGTRAHNEDFEVLAAPAIARMFATRDNVRLVTMGYLPLPDVLQPHASKITQLPPVWDVNTFWSALSEVDINLSVLKPGVIADCKSEIKWLEAAMLGIPSVVSATQTHTELLTDGRDAMLADSAEAWERKLADLIDSAKTRRNIGDNAKRLAFSKYSLAAGAENIAEIISTAFRDRSPNQVSPSKKPLIMLVNVFFWPQMTGGATRVVRDNLEYLQDHYGNEFEFQVFCTVEGARKPYEVRTSYYHGVRVTSVTHPTRAAMDWEPADDRMGQLFRAHLELWKPSLIHFHCIQRLSVCAVEAAHELEIPYLVTVHDGWWISDHQFLVDEKGRVVSHEESSAIKSLQRSGANGAGRIGRSFRLRTALALAERVLTVSAPFERVYRMHGVTNIRTLPNGVSKLPSSNRRPSDDGKVRLGFVGGLSDHKGYGLIKRALQSTRFSNLSLTVVDHALGYRETRAGEVWGSTPVRIVGRVPQNRIMELYDDLDVLLAPSIWPESFGLVTREALMAGLWVIASNRGAVGEDVKPDVNGFVIEVSDSAELVGVLNQIDQTPARFRVPPLSKPEFRKTEAQGEELAILYRQVLFAEQHRPHSLPHEQSIA
jgi:glycosyltransferase involved in cell wall biosynthesis/tetratricopeptide (TPR) repeat protein